jgi:hypothetical protein
MNLRTEQPSTPNFASRSDAWCPDYSPTINAVITADLRTSRTLGGIVRVVNEMGLAP